MIRKESLAIRCNMGDIPLIDRSVKFWLSRDDESFIALGLG